jgi:hypothetical protein
MPPVPPAAGAPGAYKPKPVTTPSNPSTNKAGTGQKGGGAASSAKPTRPAPPKPNTKGKPPVQTPPSQGAHPTELDRLKKAEDKAWADYDKLKAHPPNSTGSNFLQRAGAKFLHGFKLNALEQKAGDASAERIKYEAQRTGVGSALVKDLDERGVKVRVDDDAHYPEIPGLTSRALTPGDKQSIDIRRSTAGASDSPEVLVHEGVHAALGKDLDRAQNGDASPLREHLRKLSLDPADADRIAKQTGDWGKTVGSDEHVLTSLVTTQYQRELAGKPALNGQEKDELVRRTAQRELAIRLLGGIKDDASAQKALEHSAEGAPARLRLR